MRVISGSAKGTKLFTLEENSTRPTLDRVKESLFNIISNKLQDSNVLDLFSGSGALGIESLSRGAKFVALCDNSKEAINIINKNVEKTKFLDKTKIYYMNYKECLEILRNTKFDLIFLDPPYENNIFSNVLNKILELKILNEDGIIILETDDEENTKQSLENTNVKITDIRKYGRIKLFFLIERGK